MTATANDRDVLISSAPLRVLTDNVLNIAAKSAEFAKWKQIEGEYPTLYSQATSFGLLTERGPFATAYTALETYIGTLGSNFTTLPGTNLDIVGTIYRAKFQGYYTAKTTLLNALTADAATKANWANVEGAAAVNAAVAAAQASATAGAAEAAEALLQLASISSDSVLSKGEKPEVILKWNTIAGELVNIQTKATAAGVNRTAYDAAYSALATYLGSLTPNWGDTAQDTAIVGDTFRAKFTDYYSAKTTLLNAIAADAAVRGDAAQATANQATIDAANAKSAADSASASASAANAALAVIANDSVLSRGEKPAVILNWEAIYAESSSIPNQASALGVSSAAYGIAYNNLASYLGSLVPQWAETTSDTPINPGVFRSTWTAYYSAKVDVLNAIAAKAATTANWANGLTGRPSDAELLNSAIRLGGRNFFLNSQHFNEYANNAGTGTSVLQSDESTPYYLITAPNGVSTYGAGFVFPKIPVGTVCTLSADVRVAVAASVGFYGGIGMQAVPANKWTRIFYTFPYDPVDRGTSPVGFTAALSELRVRNYKMEIGNIGTDWSPAPEDVDAMIAEAQAAATAAQNSADNGAAQAAEALVKLSNIGSDLILSPGEKPEVLQKWNVILSEHMGVYDRGTEYGLFSLRDAFYATVSALDAYLISISGWNVIPGGDVAITSTFRTRFENYYLAKQTLLNFIATEAGKRAVWATGITGRPADHELLNSAIAKGTFINQDPNFAQPALWSVAVNSTGGNVNLAYVPDAPGSAASTCVYPDNNNGTGDASVWLIENRFYPVDPSRLYEMSAKIYGNATDSGRIFYLAVNFYDYAGTQLPNAGWGGTWSGYPATGNAIAGQFTRFAGDFGTGSIRAIPSNATQMRVAIILNYGPSGVSGARMAAQDLKVVDITEIKAAHNAAIAAQATADSASTQAAAANTAVGNISSDNVLSMSEKSEVILKFAAMEGEFNDIIAKADAVSVSRTVFYDSRVALNAYLLGLSPAWNDVTTDTSIVGTTFRAYFYDYYSARQLLLNAIAAKAATTANWTNGLVNRPTDAQLLNNRDNVIENPGGGIRMQQAAVEYGAIKIMLPVGWSDTMLKFTVDIYEYRVGYSCQVEISGYNYNVTSSWINVSARMSSSSGVVEYPVYFGYDDLTGKCTIWIGSTADDWSYPQIRIKDVFLGYNAVTKEMWENGWNISISTAVPTHVSQTVLDTLPGSDWTKVKGAAAVNAAIVAAQATATNAANAAAAAQADADAAEAVLNGVVSDNILSRTEKSDAILNWNNVLGEIGSIQNQANNLGVSHATYTATYNALSTYLGNLSPGWADLAQDTPITGSTYRAYWTDYNTAKVAVLNAISAEAAVRAQWGSVQGAGKPENYATVGANKDNLNVSLPGDNLCQNSSFERHNGSLADGFGIYNNAGVAEPTTSSIITGRRGGAAQTISWTGSHYQTKGIYGPVCTGGWVAGKTYTISFDACTTSLASTGVPFLAWNSAPTVTVVSGPNITPSWQRYVFRIVWGASVEALGQTFISAPYGDGSGNIHFDDLMVTEGDVAAQWYPSTLDAQATADAAKSQAAIANAVLANISNDNVLTSNEKPALVQAYAALNGETTALQQQAANFNIGNARTNYLNAYYAVNALLTASPGWDVIPGSDVAINGQAYRDTFANYYINKQTLINELAAVAGGKGDAAQSTANTAVANAAAAQSAANSAQSAANSANAVLANIASDNVLTPVEKPALVQAWSVIQTELQAFYDQGTNYGLITTRNAYDASYYDVANYLNTIPGWNTIPGSDVAIVGSTLRARFAAYYVAKQTLLNGIVDNAKARAATAQSTADTAVANAAAAQSTANTAAANAATANAALAIIASDGWLSKGEKAAVIKDWEAAYADGISIPVQAISLGVPYPAYTAAYQALSAYLGSLSPYWSDTGSDTPINPTEFRTKWYNLHAAKVDVLNAIAAKTATLSTWDGTTGVGKPENYATVGADASNLKVGVGGKNQLTNSLPNSTSGFTHYGTTGVWLEQNGPVYEFGGPYSSDLRGSVYMHWQGSPANGTFHDLYSNNANKMRVTAGQRYEFGVDLSTHRCISNVVVTWYTSGEVFISEQEATQLSNDGAIYTSSPFPRSTLFATAPAGAVFALVFVRARFIGQPDPYVFTSKWSGGVALASQTTASPWSESPSALSANIAAAQAVIDNISSDNVISKAEKPDFIIRWKAITDEVNDILTKADSLAVSRVNYLAAYQGVNSYIPSGWDNLATDTAIDGANLRANFLAYYNQRQLLLNAMAVKASTLATGVTLSSTGALSGGGTSGQLTTVPVVDVTSERYVNRPPTWYPVGTIREFKQSEPLGLPAGAYWCTLETIKQFTDNATGFPGYQYAYQGTKTYRRQASSDAGTGWTAWVQDLDRNAYTGDLDATKGNSLVPGIFDAVWTQAPGIVSTAYTDGAVGPTVRRSTTGIYQAFHTDRFFPLNRTRKYRTRFWARAAAGTNGTLYHALQQIMPDGNGGPANSGLSPYQPAAVAPHTNWVEYNHEWTSADWQPGVTQLRPYFLLNYNGTAGYWEIQDYVWSDITEAYDANAAAVAAAGVASAATNAAASANAALSIISSDGWLSKGEKPAVIKDWEDVYAEAGLIPGQASSLGVSSSAYGTAYTNLFNYLGGLSPSWSDVNSDTPIVGGTFRATWYAYNQQKVSLLNAIAAKAATMASGVTLSNTGILSGGGTSGQITSIVTLDLGEGTHFGARNRSDFPIEYPAGTSKQFKLVSAFPGLPAISTYFTLETVKQFANASGGGIYQYAYIYDKTYRRWSGNADGSAEGTWSSWVIDLDRNSYTGDLNASSDIKLGARNLQLNGNSVTKLAGGNAWDADCFSYDSFANGAYVSVAVPQSGGQLMFGLNSDPLTDSAYSNLDYAIYLAGTDIYVYESNVTGPIRGTFVAGDIFTVTYDNASVVYRKNGYSFHTTAAAPGKVLHFDSSILSQGHQLTNIRFGPYSPNDWASVAGPGRPQDNATDGATWGVNVGGSNKPADNATVGAVAGVNLKDNSGAVLVDAAIKNFHTEGSMGHLVRPSGGTMTGYGSNATGALAIYLPAARYASSTMLRIRVEIYEYDTGKACTYMLSGYNDTSQVWYHPSASYDGPVAGRKQVRFGRGGGREVIYIGETNSIWQYPQVRITEVTTGFSGFDASLWSSGWLVQLDVGFGTIEHTVASPGVGGALARVDQITSGNVSTLIGNAAITDDQIANSTFTVSIDGILDTSKSNASVPSEVGIGTLTANVTGPSSYTVLWTAVTLGTDPDGFTGLVAAGTPTSTSSYITAKVSASNVSVQALITLIVTDSRGRSRTATRTVSVQFGSPQ